MRSRIGLNAVYVVALMIALSAVALGMITVLWADDDGSPKENFTCVENAAERHSIIDELRPSTRRWM